MGIEQLHDLESEKALLSSVLLKGGEALSQLEIVPEDFYLDLHRRLYQSILYLIDENMQVDPLAVTNYLKDQSLFKNEEQEKDYILSLFRDTIVIQPITYYGKRVKKFSDRRRYVQILQDSIQNISEDSDDNENLFTRIETELSTISKNAQQKGLRHIRDDKIDLIDYVKLMFATKGGTSGLKTHFKDLDELTTGLKPHELIILAARPGYGKTTFALNVAANVALKEKLTVALFSLEMSRIELLIKMVCSHARINSTLLKTGAVHPSDQEKLINSIMTVLASDVYIDDSGTLTIWEFKARVRQLLTHQTPSLIVVDYLQLMSDPSVKEGRQQEVASISRNLKQIAREANCPIIALSQMSRAIESRTKDQRPQLSDLRESGAIEQDADIVSFIYREDKVKEDVEADMVNKAEIIIAKNRAGQTGSFHLLFSPEYSRFDNL
ncbi:MAG: replicative DNA helicase [Spirochaetota bacterium]